MYKTLSILYWMVPKSVKIIFGFQSSIGSVSKLLAFKKIQFVIRVAYSRQLYFINIIAAYGQ